MLGAVSFRIRSVSISHLVSTVMEKDICSHLESSGISGSRICKVASKSAPRHAFMVDIIEQYYELICSPSIWRDGVKVREWTFV